MVFYPGLREPENTLAEFIYDVWFTHLARRILCYQKDKVKPFLFRNMSTANIGKRRLKVSKKRVRVLRLFYMVGFRRGPPLPCPFGWLLDSQQIILRPHFVQLLLTLERAQLRCAASTLDVHGLKELRPKNNTDFDAQNSRER